MSARKVSCCLLGTLAALAISAPVAKADPPGRVARIAFIGGSVSFRPSSLDEWNAAYLNYPLTIGDHLWTDRGARAELQLGPTVVRVAPLTELSVLNLDDRTAQLRVSEGAVSVRVRSLNPDDVVEIDTPNGAISLLDPGLYRVDVSEAGDSTTVTVRRGEAEVTTGGSTQLVDPDGSLVLTGLDAPRSESRRALNIDDFEDWCLTRERRVDNAQAAHYVSPDMIGYEDLDGYGDWQMAAEYGAVWVPRVRAEWVPYRYGHWGWVEPWGWTWVDDAAWGFAPFHYGRWVRMSAGWAWVPGRIVARPVYAPALVAFVGGLNWQVSFAAGAAPVAWFPLGPREPFVPMYQVSPAYVQRVNVSHVVVTNITVTNNITYVNREVPGAITAVPRAAFVRAQPIAPASVAVPREQARVATVVGTAAPVAPQRESIRGLAQARVPAPPNAALTRTVVVRRAPPAPPISLAARQTELDAHPGRPVDEQTLNSLRPRAARPNEHPLVKGAPLAAAPPATPAVSPGAVPPSPRVAPPGPRVATPPPVPQPPPAPPAPQAPPAPRASQAPQVAPAPQAIAPGLRPQDLEVRHAQERAAVEAKQMQERAALLAQHQQEAQRAAADERQRAAVQQRHQQELQVLQEKHRQEQAATEKRQADEHRRAQPPEKPRDNKSDNKKSDNKK